MGFTWCRSNKQTSIEMRFKNIMNLEKAKKLFSELEEYLNEYVDYSICSSYKIVKSTVAVLISDEKEDVKKQFLIQSYKSLYTGRGGLTEFCIWDNDFETRKKLNEPLTRIRKELWVILKGYV